MENIHKITNIALIFTLIGMFLCQDLCALRVPMNGHKKVENFLISEQKAEIASLIEEFNSLKVFGRINRKRLDEILTQIEKRHSGYYKALHQRAVPKSKRDNKPFDQDYIIYFLMEDIIKHPEILKNVSRRASLIFKEPENKGPAARTFGDNQGFFNDIKEFLEDKLGKGYLKGRFAFEPGTGFGELASYLKGTGANVFVVDFRRQFLNPEEHIYHADAEETPFADGVFDITADANIFFKEVTSPEKLDRIIEELWRISKDGSYHFYFIPPAPGNKEYLIKHFTDLGFELVEDDKALYAIIFKKPDQALASRQGVEVVYGDVDMGTSEAEKRIVEILKIDHTNTGERNKVCFRNRVECIQRNLMKLIYLTDAEGKKPVSYILYEPKEGNLAHFRRIFIKEEYRQKGLFGSLVTFSMDKFDGIIMNIIPDEYEAGDIDDAVIEKTNNLTNMCYSLGFKKMTTGEFYWIKPGSNNKLVIEGKIEDIEKSKSLPYGPYNYKSLLHALPSVAPNRSL